MSLYMNFKMTLSLKIFYVVYGVWFKECTYKNEFMSEI